MSSILLFFTLIQTIFCKIDISFASRKITPCVLSIDVIHVLYLLYFCYILFYVLFNLYLFSHEIQRFFATPHSFSCESQHRYYAYCQPWEQTWGQTW